MFCVLTLLYIILTFPKRSTSTNLPKFLAFLFFTHQFRIVVDSFPKAMSMKFPNDHQIYMLLALTNSGLIKAASIDPSISACLRSEAFLTSANKQTRKNRLCEVSYGSGWSSNNREVPDFILFFPLKYQS